MTKKVLIIDDEEAVRNSFQLALEDSGFIVEFAENGKIGVEKFAGGNFSLVFIDLKMPIMDGPTALKKIREQDADIPVYVVTAFSQEFFGELKEIMLAGHHFELLKKPVGLEEILSLTKSVLDADTNQEQAES